MLLATTETGAVESMRAKSEAVLAHLDERQQRLVIPGEARSPALTARISRASFETSVGPRLDRAAIMVCGYWQVAADPGLRRRVAWDTIPMTAKNIAAPDFATSPDLQVTREALLAREPLFHRQDLVSTRADFERETATDFWEVGASGRCYSREAIWDVLAHRYSAGSADVVEGWQISDSQARRVGQETYVLTYTLSGPGDRLTRRLTIWQGSIENGWMSLYHQGTLVEPG
ncbi:MAG: hypothetical protein ABI746_12585 [Dermatophilaceae bacterium]